MMARMHITPVHPHVRGEHALADFSPNSTAGSSPRAWGTHDAALAATHVERFIPTCVGNTCISAPPAVPLSVHPHVRGEHVAGSTRTVRTFGSSPRAWGTRRRGRPQAELRRFIPTCVGNTPTPTPASRATTVHPHVRGEHAASVQMPYTIVGSSPRAWGTLALNDDGTLSLRFIPTCVGNTGARSAANWRRTVHPHVRGEHTRGASAPADYAGSSPRAWGTRLPHAEPAEQRRFIPTCVGNTR